MKKIALCLTIIMALLIPGAVLATEPEGIGSTPLVEMNGKEYASISEAIEDINDSSQKTIKLLRDEENGAGFVIPEDFNIVIDFNGKTYNVTEPLVGSKDTETNGCQLLRDSTIVFKNGTLKSASAYILVQNYSNLTLQDMTLDATASEVNDYVMSNNNGKVSIEGNTSIKGDKVAFDVCWAPNGGAKYPDGAQVTVDTYGIIKGDIELGTWGTISESNQNNVKSTLTINSINHNGKISITKEYLNNQITINGGTYSTDVTAYLAEGLFCPFVNEQYVVKSTEKIKITVDPEESEGGTVTVDKKSAQYGETVKVTVKVNDGYKIVSLECGDQGMGGNIMDEESTTNDFETSFVMLFDSEVTIIPTFEKLPVVEEEEEVEEEEVVLEVVVPENVEKSEELDEMLEESLKELIKNDPDLADIIANNDVKVEVLFDDTVVIPEDEKKEIEEAANKEVADLKVAKYIDIVISVKNKETKEHLTNLEEVEEEIKFTVAIPQEILDDKVEDGFVRKYFIIRNHNGLIDVWEVEEKDGKVEFGSNLFSTYAIAYKDVETTGSLPGASEDEKLEEDGKKDEDEKLEQDDKKDDEKPEDKGDNPTTGDNIVLYVVTLVVAVVGIASVVIIKKRNSLKK